MCGKQGVETTPIRPAFFNDASVGLYNARCPELFQIVKRDGANRLVVLVRVIPTEIFEILRIVGSCHVGSFFSTTCDFSLGGRKFRSRTKSAATTFSREAWTFAVASRPFEPESDVVAAYVSRFVQGF